MILICIDNFYEIIWKLQYLVAVDCKSSAGFYLYKILHNDGNKSYTSYCIIITKLGHFFKDEQKNWF